MRSALRARKSNDAYPALASATTTAVATVMRVATFTGGSIAPRYPGDRSLLWHNV